MYEFGINEDSGCVDVLLVSQFSFSDGDNHHMPVKFPLYFLSILGWVAQADSCDITQVLGRKLKSVDISPKKWGTWAGWVNEQLVSYMSSSGCKNLRTYRKNLFFFDEFSITNSLDRPFLPSRMIQAFSLVSASAVSPVVTQISYSWEKTWTQLKSMVSDMVSFPQRI